MDWIIPVILIRIILNPCDLILLYVRNNLSSLSKYLHSHGYVSEVANKSLGATSIKVSWDIVRLWTNFIKYT